MFVGPDRDKYRDARVELVGIQQGDPLADNTCGFQLLDAPPAGRRRQAYLLRDICDREGGIILQNIQNFLVDGIHDEIFSKSL